jgi:uncharacterized protein (TIGR01777 family)
LTTPIPYLVAGGTGFVGTALVDMLLKGGHLVYILTTQKNINPINSPVQYIYWDTNTHTIDPSFTLSNCIIVNLAGAGVADKRWTAARKQEIKTSRINSVITLHNAIKSKQLQPIKIVSSSAIGYYGNEHGICNELTYPDESYLSTVCLAWENEILQIKKESNIPINILRIGIVLGVESGALKEFLNPLRFGIAGIPGNGNQVYSWIHISDLCAMILFCSNQTNDNAITIYNAVAPNPCNLNSIMDEVIKYKKALLKIHIPSFLIKLLLGEMAVEVLKSTMVSSIKIVNDGFVFQFPSIDIAINNLLYEKEDDFK